VDLLVHRRCRRVPVARTGANLASLINGRGWPLSFADATTNIPKLVAHFRSRALAYLTTVQADVAGPVLYWSCVGVGVVFVAVAVLAIIVGVRFFGTRTEAVNCRRRLGVPTEPSMATQKELKPLFVRTPEADRLVLMRYKRGWLATEARTYDGRRGIQGAVAVIGASQSGKTTALVESVKHWSGPAVVCSVKTDLMRLTIDAARERGDVKVFDPLGISSMPTARWSPLRAAVTLEGATAAASLLVHAAGDGTSNDRFWRGQAEQLLAGMLWAAANVKGHTMTNVVTWVLSLDMPDGGGRGTLAPLVRLLRDSKTSESRARPRRSTDGCKVSGRPTRRQRHRCTRPHATPCGPGRTRGFVPAPKGVTSTSRGSRRERTRCTCAHRSATANSASCSRRYCKT
jgi:Type IV secretory system Conjugative DNA transfer